MSTTPVRTGKRRRKAKKTPMLALLAGMGLVCALVCAILLLEHALEPEAPTEPSVVVETLPENPYRTAVFSRDGQGYLTADGIETRTGIDVSDYQRDIDWQQVAEAGIEFAFVRMGYRGYSQGILHPDEMAATNIENAQAAGLDVGAYFFSQAITPEEAEEEAVYCLALLERYDLQLPVVYDWEYISADARTANLDSATLTQCAIRFCQTIEAAGLEAMVYANPDIALNRLDLKLLQRYDFWLALYDNEMDYPYQARFWQYTDSGTVPGIEGSVDLNIQFIG